MSPDIVAIAKVAAAAGAEGGGAGQELMGGMSGAAVALIVAWYEREKALTEVCRPSLPTHSSRSF